MAIKRAELEKGLDAGHKVAWEISESPVFKKRRAEEIAAFEATLVPAQPSGYIENWGPIPSRGTIPNIVGASPPPVPSGKGIDRLRKEMSGQ